MSGESGDMVLAPASDEGSALLPGSGSSDVQRPLWPAGSDGVPMEQELCFSRGSKGNWKGRQVGQYRLQRLLGAGSMAVVVQAEDLNLHRTVALKFLRKNVKQISPADQIQQFFREARCAAALEHPNIVQVYGFQEYMGQWVLVMEHLEGGSLTQTLEQSGPLNPKRACLFIADAASGLNEAHASGIVHRDIKPSNLLLTRMGRCKVGDFGLVRPTLSRERLRLDSMRVGTPHFMPPEVVLETPATPASDVYSLCASLYMVIGGRPPFPVDDAKELGFKILEEPAPDVREIAPHTSPVVAELIHRGLSKEPHQRPTAVEVASILRAETASMSDGSGVGFGIPSATLPGSGFSEAAASAGSGLGSGMPSPIGTGVATSVEGSTAVQTQEPAKKGRRLGLVLGAAGAVVIVGVLAVGFSRSGASDSPRASVAPGPQDQALVVDVAALKAKTDLMFEKVSRYDETQSLRVLLERAAAVRGAAAGLQQTQQLEGARQKLSELADLCRQIDGLESQREEANRWRSRALAEEQRVRGKGVPESPDSPLMKAAELSTAAGASYDKGEFAEAGRKWNKSTELVALASKWADATAAQRAADEAIRQVAAAGADAQVEKEMVRAQEQAALGRKALASQQYEQAQKLFMDASDLLEKATGLARERRAAAAKADAAVEQQIRALHARAAEQFALARTGRDSEAAGTAMQSLDSALALRPNDAACVKLKREIAQFLRYRPGQRYENSVGISMSLIPAGSYVMGSPVSERLRDEDENQVRVTVSKAFYLGRTEVTQRQWEAVMGKGYVSPDGTGAKTGAGVVGPDMPVTNVSWNDAVAFCRKLSQKEGRTYRLPTEAEWEYACRAGTTTPFCHGENLTNAQAQVDGARAYAGKIAGKTPERPQRVASFPSNAWGLYDMHGNAAEWCSDWYAPYPIGEAKDPTGPAEAPSLEMANRVVRGGAWNQPVRAARSASRWNYSPVIRTDYIGFRVAMTVSEDSAAAGEAAADARTSKDRLP